jgi:hypothetical protein
VLGRLHLSPDCILVVAEIISLLPIEDVAHRPTDHKTSVSANPMAPFGPCTAIAMPSFLFLADAAATPFPCPLLAPMPPVCISARL